MKKASNHLCNPNKSANFVANETKNQPINSIAYEKLYGRELPADH